MRRQPKSFGVFIRKKYKLLNYTSQNINQKRIQRKKQKIDHFRTKDNKRFVTLPYDILYEIFFFLLPWPITLDNIECRNFRKLKFVCRTFNHFYKTYFNKFATKYYLISKYDLSYDPPTRYRWSIRYCPK